MARPWVPDFAASEVKCARRSSSACFEKALREFEMGRVRSRHEASELRRGKAAAAAVAVVPRRVVPGGHDEAGRGGRRGRSL
jgi:hypothetical protein